MAEPTKYSAPLWLGYSLAKLGRYEQASAAFGRAESLRPGDYDANFWRGLMLLRVNRFPESIPNLERALASRPGARDVRWLLFAGYLATGQGSKIAGLHLGLAVSFSILLVCLYVPAIALLLRKSVRLDSRPAPGLGFALAWCAVMVEGQTAFILLPVFAFSWSMSRALGLGVSLSALPLIAAAGWGFARQPWGAPFVWPPRIPGGRLILAAFVGLGGVLLLDEGYSWLVQWITGHPMPDQMITSWLGAGTQEMPWLVFCAVALVAPAAEEILFRGLLFGAIGKRLSPRWTIAVTAAVFAVAHLQPVFFVPLFFVGLLLGWARDRSGGLALPILIHCVNNTAALLVAMWHVGGT